MWECKEFSLPGHLRQERNHACLVQSKFPVTVRPAGNSYMGSLPGAGSENRDDAEKTGDPPLGLSLVLKRLE